MDSQYITGGFPFAWYSVASNASTSNAGTAITVLDNTPAVAASASSTVKYAQNGLDVLTPANLLDSPQGKTFAISQLDTVSAEKQFNNYLTIGGVNVKSNAENAITAIIITVTLTNVDSRDTTVYDLSVTAAYGGDGDIKYYIGANLSAALGTSAQTLESGEAEVVASSTAGSNGAWTVVVFVDGTTEEAHTASSTMLVAFALGVHA